MFIQKTFIRRVSRITMRKIRMEVQNDYWHAIQSPTNPDVISLTPKNANGKEIPDDVIIITYKQLRALSAIIVEVARSVETQ